MITWMDVLVREQRRRELLEEANRQRFVRQASNREATPYQLFLARLGGQLVKWGCHLQAKYGTLAEATNSVYHVKALRQQFSVPDASVSLSTCSGRK